MKKIVIAIDGHSSCGKSTMAKFLAKEIGYIYIDTGAMYRAVTLYVIRHNLYHGQKIDTEKLQNELGNIHISFHLNSEGKPETYLNGENIETEIRGMQVSNLVSPVATIPFVREHLVSQQQEMGKQKGIIMDGRDIGTTVFPDAELKIFVTASAETRAKFRYKELIEKGQPATFEEVLKNVQERDYIDSHREVSPLRKAEDAIELDCGGMTMDEQNAWALKIVKSKIEE